MGAKVDECESKESMKELKEAKEFKANSQISKVVVNLDGFGDEMATLEQTVFSGLCKDQSDLLLTTIKMIEPLRFALR